MAFLKEVHKKKGFKRQSRTRSIFIIRWTGKLCRIIDRDMSAFDCALESHIRRSCPVHPRYTPSILRISPVLVKSGHDFVVALENCPLYIKIIVSVLC
jgi:hypothetical protein